MELNSNDGYFQNFQMTNIEKLSQMISRIIPQLASSFDVVKLKNELCFYPILFDVIKLIAIITNCSIHVNAKQSETSTINNIVQSLEDDETKMVCEERITQLYLTIEHQVIQQKDDLLRGRIEFVLVDEATIEKLIIEAKFVLNITYPEPDLSQLCAELCACAIKHERSLTMAGFLTDVNHIYFAHLIQDDNLKQTINVSMSRNFINTEKKCFDTDILSCLSIILSLVGVTNDTQLTNALDNLNNYYENIQTNWIEAIKGFMEKDVLKSKNEMLETELETVVKSKEELIKSKEELEYALKSKDEELIESKEELIKSSEELEYALKSKDDEIQKLKNLLNERAGGK
jgi:hypothetical protein